MKEARENNQNWSPRDMGKFWTILSLQGAVKLDQVRMRSMNKHEMCDSYFQPVGKFLLFNALLILNFKFPSSAKKKKITGGFAQQNPNFLNKYVVYECSSIQIREYK